MTFRAALIETHSNNGEISWMQPITLIGVALTGKVAQKKQEASKVDMK